MTSVLTRKAVAEDSLGAGPGEGRGQDHRDAAQVQGTPGAPRSREPRKAPPRQGSEGLWPRNAWISDVRPLDRKTASTCSFESPGLPQDTKATLPSWSAGRLLMTGAQGAARVRGRSGLRPGSLPRPAESHTLCPVACSEPAAPDRRTGRAAMRLARGPTAAKRTGGEEAEHRAPSLGQSPEGPPCRTEQPDMAPQVPLAFMSPGVTPEP